MLWILAGAKLTLDALYGCQQHLGIGGAVAPRIFFEKPAAARASRHRRVDEFIIGLGRRRCRHRG
jgi:hypothetical protein